MPEQHPTGADRFAEVLGALWTAVDFLLEQEMTRAPDVASSAARLACLQRLRAELRRLVEPLL